MSTMTARDHALRIATLEALKEAVLAEYEKARQEAEPVFAAKYAEEGNDRQAVLLPDGTRVGQITIKAPPPVVDMPPDALLDWCCGTSPPPSIPTSTRPMPAVPT